MACLAAVKIAPKARLNDHLLQSQTDASTILAALAYADQGHLVFPLTPRSNQPLIPAKNSGRGLHDATIDPEVIKRWFQDHATAIGLTAGISFNVIDLDGEPAIATLEEARAEGNG